MKKYKGIFETTATRISGTSDMRGHKFHWICPNCDYKKNYPYDTVFWSVKYGKSCDRCGEHIVIINPEYGK